ncbi:hypothetical protein [Flavobacterium sp.]|jgi:hypothetical protein|uniref:hypothetical protein n=1 Tax=Flavobacterium sp. TaxID=239 RepID=UPI0037C0164B
MSNDAIGITGTDGYTPIYQPTAAWKPWSIHEIYLGEDGQNKYIPKVNDWVMEPETGKIWRVADLSLVTLIPELVPLNVTSEVTVNQIVGMSAANHRLYFDKSVTPHTLSVDSFMRVHGSENSYARIYRGSYVDPTKIISRRYNNSGNFIGHDIPLELVGFNSHDNYAIKSIPTCNTDVNLLDGEVVTVVIFNSSGKQLGRATCVVDETTFVAPAFAEQKYVTNIFLKSAFIEDMNDKTINFPVNMNIQSFNPIGVVQYNDGSQTEYVIDGDRFSLFGMGAFVSTVIGHRVPLTLQYKLQSNEAGLDIGGIDNDRIAVPYDIVVSAPNTSYSVKIFVYPVWVDSVSGYRLKGLLTNLDRNVVIDISNHLTLASNSPAFNPLGYGLTQRLIFSINLSNVSSIFNYFIHVQVVDVVLRAPAHDDFAVTLWEVASQVPAVGGYYGTGLKAVTDLATRRKVYIDSGIQTVEEFINRAYKLTMPLYNPVTETGPLTPTHVEVTHLTEKITLPIESFKLAFQFTNVVPNLSNVDIVFKRVIGDTVLKLSAGSLTVRY